MISVYARQSLEKIDSISVDTQFAQCRRFTDDEVDVFFDKGFSGKNTNRPAFQRMMEAVKSGQISKILVYRLDRFSRSIADFSQIWALLEQHGVEFQSVTENFDTSSPIGRAMLNIVLVFAQLERETTAERVKDNYQHRFALGAWPGGPAPYGYSLTKITTQDGRRESSLVANEFAPIVSRIFELYSAGDVSLRALAKILNDENIPGPRRKTWDNVTLARILHSPLYVMATEDIYWWYLAKGLQPKQDAESFDGIHACNVIGRRDRSKGKYCDLENQQFSMSNHEGFIPAELWLACQVKLDTNQQIPNKNAGKNSWLTGLMKCASCGYSVKVVKDGHRRYLICSGRANMASCSETIRVDLTELEQAVADKLQQFLDECPAEEIYPAENHTAQELQQIDTKIERLVSALAESSAVSATYVSAQIERLHHQREKLLAELATKPHTGAQRTHINFSKTTPEERKIIAREFIDKILLKDDSVEIIWKF